MLTSAESFWLRWHVDHGGRAASRQASALLQAADGLGPDAIAARLKLKPASVTRWLKQFQQKRLGMFPQPALFMEELLEAAHVDMDHARQVADHALRLFDETRPIHQLPARQRDLLETAALLHNVGLEVDASAHHTTGRDMLNAMTLVGYTAAQRAMLACAVRFHRKSVRPNKEPLFARLNAVQQRQTLALSALLRVADGLDYSQSQTTRVQAVTVTPAAVTLTLAGPCADGDGDRARVKADLWAETFGVTLELEVAAAPIDLAALAQAPLTADSTLAEATTRALADQWTRWEAAEAEARAGAPPAVKAVRAAARRSRAALELFRPYLRKKPVQALRRQFKGAEDALAEVRDWDVLIAEAEKTASGQAWAFLENWRQARQAALRRSARWLAGDEVAQLRAALTDFIAEPPARRKRAQATLRTEARALFQERLATLREYAAALDERDLTTFHDLRRVAVKRCRFALEFMAPALGEPAGALLKQIVRAQERLGELNDACVARDRLTDWLADHPEDDDARRYLAARHAAAQKHLRKFPRDWAAIEPDTLDRKLRAALAPLLNGGPEPEADEGV